MGRTLDLESAYRQVALHKEEQWCSILLVWDPHLRKPRLFVQHALPFGAAASVLFFNRCSVALRAIGISLYHLPWCSYFDDFPHLEYKGLCDMGLSSAKAMLRTTGWRFSEDEHKDAPFQQQFDCLGVRLDLRQSDERALSVGNKDGRVQTICDMIGRCISKGTITRHEADCLRGRVQYATGQMFDRAGRILTALLLDSVDESDVKDNRSMLSFASDLIQCLENEKPRVIHKTDSSACVVVFTDGAYEEGRCSCGAMIFDEARGKREFFGFIVEPSIVNQWRSEGSKQPIALAELLPVVLAKFVWADHLVGKHVIYFVDNNAVMFQLISGSAKNRFGRILLLHAAKADLANRAISWYTRVPSPSNPADGPSRLKFAEATDVFLCRPAVFDAETLSRQVCCLPPFKTLGNG